MKRDFEIKKLSIYYHDRIVGLLAYLPNGQLGFQYDEEWLRNGFSISPFSLPLKPEPFFAKNDTFGGLFGVFDDSLPEGWGSLLLVRKLREEGYDYLNLNPLAKLSLVSASGKGALTYRPNFSSENAAALSEFDAIATECEELLNGEKIKDFDRLVGLGGSSGGARPKIHYHDESGEWIVKFPTQEDGPLAGKKEYETNLLAEKAGINVNRFQLFSSKKTAGYFGAKRFDRDEKGNSIHMISLSGMLEVSYQTPVLDYIHFLQVIQKVCKSYPDLLEGFRRMVFNVLIENKDDHGKNFAFLYDEENQKYLLSPAYDLTSTALRYGHEMSANGKDNPEEKDLLEVAHHVGISVREAQRIITEVHAALAD
jgi:serine/threonine-protein kinase HipA